MMWKERTVSIPLLRTRTVISKQRSSLTVTGDDELNIIEARIAERDSNNVNNYKSRSYHVSKENSNGCDGDCGNVYPNPVTQNSFCIKSGFLTSDQLTIRVINMMGQKIFEQTDLDSNPGDVFPVYIGLQAKGVYAVQLILGDETCTSKFINLPGEGSYPARNICYWFFMRWLKFQR